MHNKTNPWKGRDLETATVLALYQTTADGDRSLRQDLPGCVRISNPGTRHVAAKSNIECP